MPTLLMDAPPSGIGPVVSGHLMPSGTTYTIDRNGQIRADPLDVGVHLTPTDIKSATPTVIVPAPGAGNAIWGIGFFGQLKFNTTTYSGGDNSTDVYFGDANGAYPGLAVGSQLINMTQSTWWMDSFNNPTGATPLSLLENKPLVLASIAPPTVGDGDLYISMVYIIVALHL